MYIHLFMAKANRKKRMVPIGFEPDDDIFILQHNARTGNSYQHFVSHAVKKEIALLKKIAADEAKRQANKSLNKS